jgi:hypothetical protein
MPEGVRKRGRQKKWLDDIKGWTGLNIQQVLHMAQAGMDNGPEGLFPLLSGWSTRLSCARRLLGLGFVHILRRQILRHFGFPPPSSSIIITC